MRALGIVAATLALHIFCIVVTVMKGKYKMALLGIFIPLLVYVSAIRWLVPNSRWAKRPLRRAEPEEAGQGGAPVGQVGRPLRADYGLAQ